MEFERIAELKKPFVKVSEALDLLSAAQEAVNTAREEVGTGYSEAVQKRLAEINPDNLTSEELKALKLGLFGEIAETTSELIRLFPDGNIIVEDQTYYLNDDGVTDNHDEALLSLRHEVGIEDEGLADLSYIVFIGKHNGLVSDSVGTLLDAQESLSGLLDTVRPNQPS